MIEYKKITKKEEIEMFAKIKQGDVYLRDDLILQNIGLVKFVVKKFNVNQYEYEDYISLGTIGLIKALDSFDASKKNRFSTYAHMCILNEILNYIKKDKKRINSISIATVIATDKNDNDLTIEDMLANSENIEETIIKEVYVLELLDGLTDKERNIMCYKYGLEDKKIKTQKEVAKKLNLSQGHIARIEKSIIRKLHQKYKKEI